VCVVLQRYIRFICCLVLATEQIYFCIFRVIALCRKKQIVVYIILFYAKLNYSILLSNLNINSETYPYSGGINCGVPPRILPFVSSTFVGNLYCFGILDYFLGEVLAQLRNIWNLKVVGVTDKGVRVTQPTWPIHTCSNLDVAGIFPGFTGVFPSLKVILLLFPIVFFHLLSLFPM